MRKSTKALFLCFTLAIALCSRAQSPQIPVAGNIGSGGVFPLVNSPAVIFATDANHTMVFPEMSGSGGFIKVTSSVSLTTTRNLLSPLTKGFGWTVENSTTGGQSITIVGTTGAGVTIPNGSAITVVSDGVNYLNVGGGSSMTWPSTPGITVCTGTPCAAWGTSLTAPSSTIVGITDTQTLLNKSISGSQINSGTIPSAQLPLGSTTVFGAVKCDGTTITCTSGVIASVGGGGGSPAGPSGAIQFNNSSVFGGTSAATLDGSGNGSFLTLATTDTAHNTAYHYQQASGGSDVLPTCSTGSWLFFGSAQLEFCNGAGSPIPFVGTTGAQTLVSKTLTAPVMTAPVLGTIASGVGTALTALNASNITSGTIPSAQLPLGSTTVFGAVKCDGTTITCTSGVIASVGGGAGYTRAAGTQSNSSASLPVNPTTINVAPSTPPSIAANAMGLNGCANLDFAFTVTGASSTHSIAFFMGTGSGDIVFTMLSGDSHVGLIGGHAQLCNQNSATSNTFTLDSVSDYTTGTPNIAGNSGIATATVDTTAGALTSHFIAKCDATCTDTIQLNKFTLTLVP